MKKRNPNSLPVLMWAASNTPDDPQAPKPPSVEFLGKHRTKLSLCESYPWPLSHMVSKNWYRPDPRPSPILHIGPLYFGERSWVAFKDRIALKLNHS